MKVFETSGTGEWRESHDGKGRFVLTGLQILFGDEDNCDELYYKTVPFEALGVSEEDLPSLELEDLENRLHALDLDLEELKVGAGRHPLKYVYPEFDPETNTQATPESPDSVFLKRTSLIVHFPEAATFLQEEFKDEMTVELRACELLKRSPHPNIATFVGCKTLGRWITGFYYERYKEIRDNVRPFDVDKYIEEIRSGIEHIHSLGYCHNDICPENTMLKDDGTAVIIDLDSCIPIGETAIKAGHEGFFPFAEGRESRLSEVENDWFGLRKTEEWMRRWNNGEVSVFW